MPAPSSAQALLRGYLTQVAQRGRPVTYRQACDSLGLTPPGMIKALARLLEDSMRDDAAAGRPFLAALVVSQSRERLGVPAPGFFEEAHRLGRFASDAQAEPPRQPEGEAARRFHEQELCAAVAYYGRGSTTE
ncbi:hypothetical protein [Onishia taeanensis]